MPQNQSKTRPGLVRVRSVTWAAVYRHWAKEELSRNDWRKHYKSLGYPTWRAWREAVVIRPFGLDQRRWKVYRVTNPKTVLEWHGGPFPRWIREYYRGAQTRSFRWLVEAGGVARKAKVKQIKKLPATMTIFGLRYRGKVYVIDGMHRCAAMAIRAVGNRPVKTKIIIALADINKLPKLKSAQT